VFGQQLRLLLLSEVLTEMILILLFVPLFLPILQSEEWIVLNT